LSQGDIGTVDGDRLAIKVRALSDQVQALLREREAEAAAQRDKDIETLRHELITANSSPTVVVVGEAKRGKSSLVNALLGSGGLSPVDADITTASYLVFKHGDAPSAQAFITGSEEPVDITVGDLSDWGTAWGSLPGGYMRPRRIDITVPAKLLTHMHLIDTPGVGGLNPEHAEIALEAVKRATVLLFVVDAISPFTDKEREFLERAASKVNFVIFVLTKRDANSDWRMVLESNQRDLRGQMARFATAPWFAVSSPQALHSNESVVARSGVAELTQALEALGRNGMALAEANIARMLLGELNRLLGIVSAKLRAVDPDPAEIRQRQQALADLELRLTLQAGDVKAKVGHQMRVVQTTMQARLNQLLSDLEARFSNVIQGADAKSLATMPEEVDQALGVGLLTFNEEADRTSHEAVERVLADLRSADDIELIRQRIQINLIHSRNRAKGDAVALDRNLNRYQGALTGLGAAGLTYAVMGAASGGLLLVPLAVGVLVGKWFTSTRANQAERANAMHWLQRVVTDARIELSNSINSHVADLTYAVETAVAQGLADSKVAIQQQAQELRKAQASDQAARQKRKQVLQSEVTTLQNARQQLTEVLAQVNELRLAANN
jgi:Dynamin family